MATINRTKVSLRIAGDDLLPEKISEILGRKPSDSQFKGEILAGKNSSSKREAKFGMWRLEAPEEIPGDLNSQISAILNSLSCDLNRWGELSSKYRMDLFCGLFMEEKMEGIDISPENLAALGQRGIELGLDIYGPDTANS